LTPAQPDPIRHGTLRHRKGNVAVTVLGADGQPLDFADVVHPWDAINEVVIMPVIRNEQHRNAITRLAWERGRIPIVRLAFEEARATNPAATLLLTERREFRPSAPSSKEIGPIPPVCAASAPRWPSSTALA
jgi:hypothetical protein